MFVLPYLQNRKRFGSRTLIKSPGNNLFASSVSLYSLQPSGVSCLVSPFPKSYTAYCKPTKIALALKMKNFIYIYERKKMATSFAAFLEHWKDQFKIEKERKKCISQMEMVDT